MNWGSVACAGWLQNLPSLPTRICKVSVAHSRLAEVGKARLARLGQCDFAQVDAEGCMHAVIRGRPPRSSPPLLPV
jgi:hypothetical protein